MLLDYVIIKLSESKILHNHRGGRGSLKCLHDYGGWGRGWPCDDIS